MLMSHPGIEPTDLRRNPAIVQCSQGKRTCRRIRTDRQKIFQKSPGRRRRVVIDGKPNAMTSFALTTVAGSVAQATSFTRCLFFAHCVELSRWKSGGRIIGSGQPGKTCPCANAIETEFGPDTLSMSSHTAMPVMRTKARFAGTVAVHHGIVLIR